MELPRKNKLTSSFAKCFLPYSDIQNQLAFCCCFLPSFPHPLLFLNLLSNHPVYHSKAMISEKIILLFRNTVSCEANQFTHTVRYIKAIHMT